MARAIFRFSAAGDIPSRELLLLIILTLRRDHIPSRTNSKHHNYIKEKKKLSFLLFRSLVARVIGASVRETTESTVFVSEHWRGSFFVVDQFKQTLLVGRAPFSQRCALARFSAEREPSVSRVQRARFRSLKKYRDIIARARARRARISRYISRDSTS